VDCPDLTLTFTILGQSVTLSTPDRCPTGRRVQDSDCFDCSVPSPGSNCDSDAFRVLVKIYSSGTSSPCPSGPDSVPETLREFTQSMACTPPPEIHAEEVGCAQDSRCEAEPVGAGELVHGAVTEDPTCPGGRRREWLGTLEGTLPPASEDEFASFLNGLPRIPVEGLPAPLAEACQLNRPLAGVDRLGARVQVEFLEGFGDSTVVNTHHVTGALCADGRFSVLLPRLVESPSGESSRRVEELAFDGATLFSGLLGSATYQAWAASYPEHRATLRNQTGFLDPLLAWVRDPFEVLRLEGTAYEEEELEGGRVRIRETYPEPHFPAWAGSTEYLLDTSTGRTLLTRVEVRTAAGELVSRREFSDHRPVGGGAWRPFRITGSRFRPGSAEPFRVSRTTIDSVGELFEEPAAAAEALDWPTPASGWWVVHES
jgi:hypothetical protein